MRVSPTALLTFGALTVALAGLWAARGSDASRRARYWTLPFAVALGAALAGGIVDVRGVVVLLAYAAGCRAASRAEGPVTRVAAHVFMLLVCGGLMLHVMPGFHNPIVISASVLSPGGVPYTKYLNFDKAVAGLFLLGIYRFPWPRPTAGQRDPVGPDSWALGPSIVTFGWRFAVLVAVVIALSLALGFVRWDPKAPAWFPLWAWSILFFTALPEEALFRGVVQTSIERWLSGTRRAAMGAAAIAAVLFGVAHLAGGPTYVVLAAAAGAGYGWIYARTRSLGAAIVAHVGVDAVHFLFFTYPVLALPA